MIRGVAGPLKGLENQRGKEDSLDILTTPDAGRSGDVWCGSQIVGDPGGTRSVAPYRRKVCEGGQLWQLVSWAE